MGAVDDYRAAVLAKLNDAGLNAMDDPATVTPPCVLLGPPVFERIALLGPVVKVLATFPVRVLVVGPGNAGALAALLGDVPAALVALARDKPSEATPFVYVVSDAVEHPGYEFTITREITL